ncbi:MAG: hypothetical protein R2867_45940 [Caldilineaceae bacterium]
MIALLGSALAAWTAKSQTGSPFVCPRDWRARRPAGSFSYGEGPTAMIWPTTAFALGGALWLVGEQVWQGWAGLFQ